jgi:hypothetical protein
MLAKKLKQKVFNASLLLVPSFDCYCVDFFILWQVGFLVWNHIYEVSVVLNRSLLPKALTPRGRFIAPTHECK